MTPREIVQAIIQGERVAQVPFIIWDNKLPGEPVTQELLALGACVIVKSSLYRTRLASIPTEVTTRVDEGRLYRTTRYLTPEGELEDTSLVSSGSSWHCRPVFKSARDYEAIYALISDLRYEPAFETFLKDDARFGDQGLARPATEKSPFFEILYDYMGVMRFAEEWAERRHLVLTMYDLLLEARRERLEIVSRSPAPFVIIDGNIEMSIVGTERFERFYLPVLLEAAALLGGAGKRTGLHLDGNNRLLAGPVAELPIPIIESFTPPPDCDLSIAEALRLWPDKCLLVNFPSSLHLAGQADFERAAAGLMAEAAGSGRTAVGVLEDLPRNDYLPLLARLVKECRAPAAGPEK
jgi:hypothetical protein